MERSEQRITVVLAGGSKNGASWVERRLPFATLLLTDTGDTEGLRKVLQEADALVHSELTAEDTAGASRLRMIHTPGAGTEGIAEGALPSGCVLCNVYEHETAIGEWVLMTMLALTRRLLVYDRELRSGEWGAAATFSGTPERDLRGKTLGLVGLGHIGRRAAELAHAVGMRPIAVTLNPSPERATRHDLAWLGGMGELHRLLGESNFVLLCVPLSPDTAGLIGRKELEAIGPDGYLLNVGRGGLIAEEPLYDALRDRTIAGAGLDVWYRYPSRSGDRELPASFPFWELDNVVMTPHSAAWSESTMDGRWTFIAEQIARLAEGRPLENVVRQA